MKQFLLILSYCATFVTIGWAQEPLVKDKPQEIPVLVFEHLDKGELKFIRYGGAIQYQLQDGSKHSGILEQVNEKTMTVQGKTVAFADCAYIKGRVRSERDVLGGVLTGGGVSMVAVGAAIIGFTHITGAAVLVTGAAILVTGITLLTGKRKFNMNKGWRVYGGTIKYQR